MAYIFGSIWDRFNRNALNDLSKSVEYQGKSIQDLVAEGQLTPTQYAQLISIVNGNVKKGGITTGDIDKNNFKVDSTMITDSLRQMIAGDAEINAVPANNSIGTEKLINESVTKAKRTVGGEMASLISDKTPINIDTTIKEVLISESSYVVTSKIRRSVLTNIRVPFNLGSSTTIAFDTVDETFRSVHTDTVHILNENEVIIMHIIFTTTSQNEVKSVSTNSEFTVNGNINLPDKSITTSKLAEGSVTPKETSFIENINLINKDDIFRGYTTDNETGELSPLSNFSTTDFIRVGGNADISFRRVEKVTYYDENKDFISARSLVATPQHITTTSNQVFIRCVIRNDRIDEAMVYTGHEVKEYEPFSVKVLGVDISKTGTSEETNTNIETVNAYPIRLQKDEIYTAELRDDVSVGSAGNIHRLNSLDIHALYDDLLNANNDYVSRELLGTEPSGKDIYAYHFNEDFSENTSSNPLKKPKILLVSGTHGHEALAVWLNYLLAKELCENWKSSDALDNLRNNVHIIIIPVQNPFGRDNISDYHGNVEGIRTNSNGVDIARNYPSQWRLSTPGTVTYSGTEPFSEIESQVVDNLIKRERENLIYVCDLHNFATKSTYVIWNASATDFHVNLAEHLVSNMFSKWRKETDFLNNLGIERVGVANYGSPAGSLGKHAVVEYGIFGDTFEVNELFPYGESDVRNLPNAVKFGEEAYVNWLSLVVKNQLNMQ